MPEVIEVVRRSQQGITRPFICRCDDEQIYFVKGKGSGRESQVFEWLAGSLGLELGLPLASFDIVDVSPELVAGLPEEWARDLGVGPAFGSKERTVNELSFSGIDEVPEQLKRDVFIFDAWIRNGDRTLFENGGNPNLFWEPASKELVVIDHNCAFDSEVDINYLLKNHVFKEIGCQMSGDCYIRQEYTPRLAECMNAWPEILAGLPHNWLYADDEMTAPMGFNFEEILESLLKYQKEEFWSW